MKVSATLVAALSLNLPLAIAAQNSSTFSDPANLRGERVSPQTGRELPVDQGELGLEQTLRRLRTRASLLLIVAHPDDEDGGMLTRLSRGEGARVATLTLTRGEGGQNAMTGDFEDALGLIRTQELLAADRYFGADQMFGTEVDFGFSKTKEEAFRKWTHQRVLYDAVRAVRLYRPLVIAAVFTGGVTDGHGQHQVSGEIAQEVFNAAADPKVFPELTREGILPWAPLKVYARVPAFAITSKGLFDYATNQYVQPSFTNYVTGQTTSTPPTPNVVVHEGDTDPLLTNASANPADLRDPHADPTARLSYVQFARIGLGLQRTQIGGNVRLAAPGAFDVAYHRYGSRLKDQPQHETSFFDDIDTSLEGIASLSTAPPPALRDGLQRLDTQIALAAKNMQPASAAAPFLIQAQHDLGALLNGLESRRFPGSADVLHALRIKQVQLNEALICALGLRLQADAQSTTADVVRDSTLSVHTELTTASNEPVGVFAEHLDAGGGKSSERLLAVDTEPTVTASHALAEELPASPALTATATRPYFTRNSVEDPVYQLRNPALRNAPATPPALTAWATLRYHQTEIQLGSVVSVGRQFVSIVPPATLMLSSSDLLLPNDDKGLTLQARLRPVQTPPVVPSLTTPPGWREKASAANQPGATDFTVTAPEMGRTPVLLKASAAVGDGPPVTEGYLSVGYPGLLTTNAYSSATLHVVPASLRLPARRHIGYLPGTGDAVADNLRSVGFDVTALTVADLVPEKLARFDAVILGVRTYNAHPDLHGAPTAALLDYARGGGNVVVQYQTGEFTAADAPYPLALGAAEKVVDETTPVRLLVPESPALATPNRITEADFAGWVEERGHGFLQSWDPHYTALTETHDPGAPAEHIAPQVPQRGGLLTTSLGKGHWTYCAFALYRQLPEAVPGAFRLLTNLVALSQRP